MFFFLFHDSKQNPFSLNLLKINILSKFEAVIKCHFFILEKRKTFYRRSVKIGKGFCQSNHPPSKYNFYATPFFLSLQRNTPAVSAWWGFYITKVSGPTFPLVPEYCAPTKGQKGNVWHSVIFDMCLTKSLDTCLTKSLDTCQMCRTHFTTS